MFCQVLSMSVSSIYFAVVEITIDVGLQINWAYLVSDIFKLYKSPSYEKAKFHGNLPNLKKKHRLRK